MARKRLTPFSKILIVAAIIAGVYFLLNKLRDPKVKEKINEVTATTSKSKDGYKDVINVGVVTWGGYAGGQYFNEGFDANTNSRFFKDYGLKVKFKVIDDFDASRDAFKNGDIDLMWATIDAFPTEVEGLSQYQPQVVFQADWSRGGDAIVSRRGINKVSDLKGKKIAVAPMTPSHSFLIWLLEAGDISPKDVKLVQVPSAIDAADAFKSGTVDAAVVWSPDDADCVSKVAGARVLESTKNATHIIADVFVAKKEFVENLQSSVQQLGREKEALQKRLEMMDRTSLERSQRFETVAKIMSIRVTGESNAEKLNSILAELVDPDFELIADRKSVV